MKTLLAFLKKEIFAQTRSVKTLVLVLLFAFFGAMNAGVAKLTPWLFEVLEEPMAQTGMSITVPQATVIDSWLQFYSNISLAHIIFVILLSNIFTAEYRSGTLILALTKGLDRYKVVISKTILLVALWTIYYWICFMATYLCNMLFWSNADVPHLWFSGICYWIYGLWVVGLMVLFSTILNSTIGVQGCTGGVVFGISLISIVPKVGRFLPSYLVDGISLIYGMVEPKKYVPALIITGVFTLLCIAASIPLFNKKEL